MPHVCIRTHKPMLRLVRNFRGLVLGAYAYMELVNREYKGTMIFCVVKLKDFGMICDVYTIEYGPTIPLNNYVGPQGHSLGRTSRRFFKHTIWSFPKYIPARRHTRAR